MDRENTRNLQIGFELSEDPDFDLVTEHPRINEWGIPTTKISDSNV